MYKETYRQVAHVTIFLKQPPNILWITDAYWWDLFNRLFRGRDASCIWSMAYRKNSWLSSCLPMRKCLQIAAARVITCIEIRSLRFLQVTASPIDEDNHHTHSRWYGYVYACVCVCVCVFQSVCALNGKLRQARKSKTFYISCNFVWNERGIRAIERLLDVPFHLAKQTIAILVTLMHYART